MKLKFCADCRHCERQTLSGNLRSFANAERLVLGREYYTHVCNRPGIVTDGSCIYERRERGTPPHPFEASRCGPEGNYWQPLDPEKICGLKWETVPPEPKQTELPITGTHLGRLAS